MTAKPLTPEERRQAVDRATEDMELSHGEGRWPQAILAWNATVTALEAQLQAVYSTDWAGRARQAEAKLSLHDQGLVSAVSQREQELGLSVRTLEDELGNQIRKVHELEKKLVEAEVEKGRIRASLVEFQRDAASFADTIAIQRTELVALREVEKAARKNHAQGGCEDCGGCCACDTELLSALNALRRKP